MASDAQSDCVACHGICVDPLEPRRSSLPMMFLATFLTFFGAGTQQTRVSFIAWTHDHTACPKHVKRDSDGWVGREEYGMEMYCSARRQPDTV